MGWKIIEVNTDDYLKLFLNNLLIQRGEKKIVIHLSDVDVLILDNYKIKLSVQLINAITDNNSIIIIFNNFHEPSSYIINVNGNYNSLKILKSQLEWTNIYKGNVWKQIIKNKIFNQASFLGKVMPRKSDDNFFNDLIDNVKEFDVSNREGHSSKVYWHLLFGIKFYRDYEAKSFPIINSMLNYGYAVLRSLVIKSIIKKGLDPRISIFHRSFSNYYALASDLMEPFRIIIDKVVYENKDAEFFTSEIKEKLVDSLTGKVFIKGKSEYINNAIDKCIDNLINGNGWIWVHLWK